MARLVEFQTEMGPPIAVNAGHVINVEPDQNDAGRSVLHLSDGATVTVSGNFADVVSKLNMN
jgi:hypothetical protein